MVIRQEATMTVKGWIRTTLEVPSLALAWGLGPQLDDSAWRGVSVVPEVKVEARTGVVDAGRSELIRSR